jgi:hypothetical protein
MKEYDGIVPWILLYMYYFSSSPTYCTGYRERHNVLIGKFSQC